MAYILEMNGNSCELPKYSINIVDKIDKAEQNMKKTVSVKEQLKMMYNLLVDITDKASVEALIGKFDEADANDINIAYLKLIKVYNSPLLNYESEEAKEKMDSTQIVEMKELLQAMAKVDLKQFAENGTPFKSVK